MKTNDSFLKKPSILLAEDSKTVRAQIKNILKNFNYTIVEARDGAQTLFLAKQILPDLILLDIIMPKIDGIAVCRLLKKNPGTKKIPVIFITAKNDMDTVVQGFQSGAADYVTKPFQAEELMSRVNTQIKLKLSQDRQNLLVKKLRASLKQIKQLSGLLPICSGCKKIRDNKGDWEKIEKYISAHSEADFTHSLCPECMEKMYPEEFKDLNK